MKRHLLVVGILLSIVLFTTTLDNVNAQNLTANVSNASGNVTAAINQTVGEMGKNASSEGKSFLNQTGEVAKKIVGGAATVLGNISGEIKEGVGAK